MGIYDNHFNSNKNRILKEFPGGLLVRVLGFHCCGPGSILGEGSETPQVMWRSQK